MDRIYRPQRHIYDLTRKFFLFGRDGLLAAMKPAAGDNILEVGCGTARNLIILARQNPRVNLFGLDASQQMLETAAAKLSRRNLGSRIKLAHGCAQALDARAMFGIQKPFDAIVFSYSLSMIPPWCESLDAAIAALKAGGTIHIVDFYDQGSWPRWFRALLSGWIALFGVHFRPELVDRLRELEKGGIVSMKLESVGGRYAYRAVLRKL